MSRTHERRNRWKADTRYRARAVRTSGDRAPETVLVRFVVDIWNRDAEGRQGVVSFAYHLLARPTPTGGEADELARLVAWFERHLAVPRRMSPFKDGFRRAAHSRTLRTPVALSWFRPEATAHLAKVLSLTGVLRRCGYGVRRLTTTNPGYVTHEDAEQVVAMPFADTRWTEEEMP